MRKNISKSLGLVMALILTGSSLTGCRNVNGNAAGIIQSDIATGETIDYIQLYRESPIVDILQGGWLKEQNVGNSDCFMKISDYHENVFGEFNDSQDFFRGCVTDGSKIYYSRVYFEDSSGEYCPITYVEILDANTFTVDVIEVKEPVAVEAEIFVSGGRIMSFTDTRDENGFVDSYVGCEIMADGTTRTMGDFVDVLDEAGWLPNKSYYAVIPNYAWNADAGEIYFLSEDGSKIYVASESGEIKKVIEGFAGGFTRLSYRCNTYEGVPIFYSYNSTSSEGCFFYIKDDEPVILYTGGLGCDMACVDSHGNIVYQNGASIDIWNTATGCRERVYYGTDDIISSLTGLVRNDNGEIILLSTYSNEYRTVSAAGPAREVTITVAIDGYMTWNFSQYMEKYEATHPGVTFEIIGEDDYDFFKRDVILGEYYTQMSAGGGPDIICSLNNGMDYFAEKGCLEDLSDAVPAEVRYTMLPGIADMGIYDGKRYAIYLDYWIDMIMVDSDIWDQPTWTAADLIDIIEEREAEGNPFESLCVSDYGYKYNPLLLFTRCLDQSPWLDLDRGICCFDSEDFVKVLEICRKYYDESDDVCPEWKVEDDIKDGKVLCMMSEANFLTFSESMNMFRGNANVVGCATEGECGLYIRGQEQIGVNKNSENMDVIKDFVGSLYSMDYTTLRTRIPYRADLYDGRIMIPDGKTNSWTTKPYIKVGRNSYCEIECKPDGTTYIDEYKQMLMSCVTHDDRIDPIRTIIYEEFDTLRPGGKTAQEVADVIQSRVSLYLAEN